MEEGIFELILKNQGRFPQGKKPKEDVPIGRRGLDIGKSMIVSGKLRRVEGRTHNRKALNLMLNEGLIQGHGDVGGEEEEGGRELGVCSEGMHGLRGPLSPLLFTFPP